jgi:hypothetical protein
MTPVKHRGFSLCPLGSGARASGVLAWVIVCLCATLGCSSSPSGAANSGKAAQVGFSNGQYQGVFGSYQLADNAHALDDASQTALSSYDSTSGDMVFTQSTPLLSSLKVGDVLVSGIVGTVAPDGFSRKITAIDTSATGTTLTTSRATLLDVFHSANLHVAQPYISSDVESYIAKMPGVTVPGAQPGLGTGYLDPSRLQTQAAPKGLRPLTAAPGLHPLDGTSSLPCADGVALNLNTHITCSTSGGCAGSASGDDDDTGPSATFKATLSGGVCFKPEVDADLDVGWYFTGPHVRHFELAVGFVEASDLSAVIDLQAAVTEEIPIANVTLAAIPIGPFVITPRIDISLTFGINGEVNLSFHATQEVTAKWGYQYYDGSGGQWINQFNSTGTFDPTTPPFAKLEVDAGAKAKFGLYLWDSIGGYIADELGIYLDLQVPHNPWWVFGLKDTASVGVDISLFSLITLVDDEVTLGEWKLPLLHADPTAPTVTISAPTAGAVSVDEGTLTPSISLSAQAVDPQDGKVPIVWSDSVASSTFSGDTWHPHQLGSHTLTATATNSLGLSGSASVTVDVQAPPPPVVKIVGPSGPIYAGVSNEYDLYFELAGGALMSGQLVDPHPTADPGNEGFLDGCSWASADSTAAQVVHSTACRSFFDFSEAGTRTISVGLIDTYGRTSSATLDVDVQTLADGQIAVTNNFGKSLPAGETLGSALEGGYSGTFTFDWYFEPLDPNTDLAIPSLLTKVASGPSPALSLPASIPATFAYRGSINLLVTLKATDVDGRSAESTVQASYYIPPN